MPMQKYLNNLSIAVLFAALICSQFIEASHLLEADCQEQNCFICPTSGDDKYIPPISQSEDYSLKKFVSVFYDDWISSDSIKLNLPIRAPPLIPMVISNA